MKNNVIDMTQKSPLELIVKFSIPIIIGNLFQQAYTIVDSIIVGRGVGTQALAAVGVVDWINWTFVATISGIAQGFSILFSRYFGAKDYKGLKDSLASGILISVLIGLFITIFSETSAHFLLKLIKTPEAIYDLSLTYVRFLYAGYILVMVYNILSSILRSLGNSRAGLIAMILASIINIGLDFIFVYTFKMGIEGAAIATIIAQFCSVLYCMYKLKDIEYMKFTRENFKFNKDMYLNLLRLGLPSGGLNIAVGIGGLIVQSVVNGFGIVFVAGVTITNKLYALFEVGGTSFGLAVSTFVAQNYGAKLKDRIYDGLKVATFLSLVFSLLISVTMIVFGKNIISLFVGQGSDVNEIINVAYAYLKTMCTYLAILYLLHIGRSGLQGLSNTGLPLISSFFELMVRVFSVTVLTKYLFESGVYYAEVFAWATAVLILCTGLYFELKKIIF